MPATAQQEPFSPDALFHTGGTDPLPSGTESHRALRVPFTDPTLYELENGDLLIKDVPLLAEGEWTDSAQKTPLFYPAKTLEEFAGNWIRRTGFNRHNGDPTVPGWKPRNEGNRVSEAINPHFGHITDEEGTTRAAVLSDLLVYGSTPNGRAMQELIKRKNIRYVSVEHGGDEVENPQTRRMEAASLVFGGFAFVNKGACKVCRINEAADGQTETPAGKPVEQETMAENKELEAAITAAVKAATEPIMKELEAVKASQKPAEVKVEIPKELADLPSQMKELAAIPAALKTITDRLDKLEKDGSGKTTAGAAKELEALPEFYVRVDRKKGTVGAE